MIKSYINGEWQEFDKLCEALGLDMKKQLVISLIGGGGKTTTLQRLQYEYDLCKVPTIATTTTHFQCLDLEWFLGTPSMEKLLYLLEKYGKVWAGEVTPKGKLQSLPNDFLTQMIALGYSVFIEADGARRLPCKAPGPNEPVYVPETNVVLSVYGLDAIGKKISETCFRPEIVAEILKKEEGDPLTSHDIAVLAADSRGGKKLVTGNMDYQVILNKADGKEELENAKAIAEELNYLEIRKVHVTAGLMK